MRRFAALLVCAALSIGIPTWLLMRRIAPIDVPPPAAPEGGFVLRVLDPEGEPARDARLDLFETSPYRLDPVPAGSVLVDRGGWAPIPAPGGPLAAVVTAPGLAAESARVAPDAREIHLDRGERVEGRVSDLRGRPIGGARVVSPPHPPFAAEALSDGDGRFVIGPVAPDSWIRAEAEGHAPLDLNLSLYPREGRDLVFHLPREWRVTGRITDSSGRGVAAAILELSQECESRIAADEEGRFDMPGVLPGWEAMLTARAPSYRPTSVAAIAGQSDVSIVLHRPAGIRGRVVAAITGETVERFEVRRHEAQALGGGEFEIRGLPPGETRVEVTAGSLVGETVVDLDEGEFRIGVVVPLYPSPLATERPLYAVTVRATEEETGRPAPGARIRLEGGYGEARTEEDGTATVGLPPGPRRLLLGGSLETYAAEAADVVVPETEGVDVRLTRNPILTVFLKQGVATEEATLELTTSEEEREVRFTGDRVGFPATCGVEVDLVLRVKGFVSVARDGARMPEDRWLPIFLERGPVVRGRCLGEAGHPLPKVVAEMEEDTVHLRAETLGDGVFEVGPLLPGYYRLFVYARNVRTRQFEVKVAKEDVDLGDVGMLAPCDIVVRTLTSDGAPVPGAVVETSHFVPSCGASDSRGSIRLPGRNPVETIHASAEGFLDAWREVEVPDGVRRIDATVTLLRPARLLVRAVGSDGRPVPVLLPEWPDLVVREAGAGELIVDRLPPGPLALPLEDREGRRGWLRTTILEGEVRVETVVLE